MSTVPTTVPGSQGTSGEGFILPDLPNAAELEQYVQRMMPGLILYSPLDHWLNIEVHGRTDLWIPPDLNGKVLPHPITGIDTVCNGRLEVRGRFPNQVDSSGKKIEGQDSTSIVKFVMENYKDVGITWLPGQQEDVDERLRELSVKAFQDFMKDRDEAVINRRAEFKKNWLSNPAKEGKKVPPPTDRENAAMERVQARKTEVRTFTYDCDVESCPGYATNSWQKFFGHMKLQHDIEVEKDRYDSEVSGLSTESVQVNPSSIEEAAQQAGILEDAEVDRPLPKAQKAAVKKRAAKKKAKKTTRGRGRGR